MEENTKRVFISLAIPEDIKKAIREVAEPFPDVEWFPPENLDMTVKFIGDTTEEQQKQIVSLMQFIAEQFKPFQVRFWNFKILGQRLRLMAEGTQELRHFYETVSLNLKKINLFHQDKFAYGPHVTLGKTEIPFVPQQLRLLKLDRLSFTTESLILYESIMGKNPSYKALVQVKLQSK